MKTIELTCAVPGCEYKAIKPDIAIQLPYICLAHWLKGWRVEKVAGGPSEEKLYKVYQLVVANESNVARQSRNVS